MTEISSTYPLSDLWRAVVLYGQNTATYKIALGCCLALLVARGQTEVPMHDLAELFFDLYQRRLVADKPQLVLPNRLTVMERIVRVVKIGGMTRDEAIDRVAAEAFGDVLPRFHTVNNVPIPVQFYDQTAEGLTVTDAAFAVLGSERKESLIAELGSRWDLLEAAFAMRRDHSTLVNDIRDFYLKRGYDRQNVTHTRPVLNGYQNGQCFYCGEPMLDDDVHVDHVIPRQFLNRDDIWNLALAHGFCNEQKSDLLPDAPFVEKLIVRNEFFIVSNHPIRDTLISQIGTTPTQRRAFIQRIYEDAKTVLGYTWSGVRGYNPATDPLYKSFVRGMIK